MAVATIRGIPVYEALISGIDCGMRKISLVDSPAVQSDFLAFDEQKVIQMYAVQDEEKRLVRGVIMRADFPIYRRDKEDFEYYVIYKPDTIRTMAEKYLLEGKQNDVNVMHDDNSDVDGVQLVQWFIKESNGGINPAGFDDIADGSLFAEFHITNDEVWKAIKDGEYKGFSLEGVFEMQPKKESKLNKQNRFSMKKVGKLFKAIADIVKTLEFGNITTDKAILYWDGEEDLKVGDKVYTEDADGNQAEVADGDYTTNDGNIYVIASGEVTEIKTVEAEPTPAAAEEPAAMQKMKAVIKAAEASYNEKRQKIASAIGEKLGNEDFYVYDAGDDFAVVCQYDDDFNEKLFRYAISWDGENVLVGEGVEGKLGFIANGTEEPAAPAPEAEAEMQKMKEQLEAANAKIVELQKQPLAKPAHLEMNANSEVLKTGNKRMDNLARTINAGRK